MPLPIALGLIYDVASQRLRDLPMPDVARAPLYDGRLSRGEKGFTWMSEMLLRDLEFWEKTKLANAEKGDQYSDRNRKAAATLAKWIAWRRLFPSELWSGKRGDDRATAAPPSRDPRINEWGPRTDKTGDTTSTGKSKPEPRHEEEPDDGYRF